MLQMEGPIYQPPSRTSSLGFAARINTCISRLDHRLSLISEEPRALCHRNTNWKPRRSTRAPELGSTARDMGVRKFDGTARSSTEWDGLRRDPELWFPEGNCLVHLYGRGQSRRGPAFRVPIEALLSSGCRPLLDRFMVSHSAESGGSTGQPNSRNFELYIPAPPKVEREQAFVFHSATRNFFAWVFGKSLVGSHLGGALVGLLNSMNEFRSPGEDNVQAIMDYMDEEGYADLRNSPDHALGVLFFAEHFQFKDMWIDAFAHCTGMHDRLASSPGFEFITRISRALITRSRMEMDIRLARAGDMLGTFLSDDLSDAHLGLPTSSRAHLDKFRSFLHSYYVAKLGYYPPTSPNRSSTSFPKNAYMQMCQEFHSLYEYLVDSNSEAIPFSQQGGICVLQSVQAFDSRNKFPSLPHTLPLLPEGQDASPSKSILSRRRSWYPKSDKMKPDPRLVAFSALSKATNSGQQSLLDCGLVRAYRGFEKECIFSPFRSDKDEKISQTDARKVRWILIYTILQTLISVTKIPPEVRDTRNVSYNLCVLVAGCLPWKESSPHPTLLRTQSDQMRDDALSTQQTSPTITERSTISPQEIKPDIDYFAITHRPQSARPASIASGSISRRGTVRRALSSLGNMPELRHPTPKRPIYHEILVHGYGNGTNNVSITEDLASPIDEEEQHRQPSSDSASTTAEDLSSRWSNSSIGEVRYESPTTNSFSSSRKNSVTIEEFLDSPLPDGVMIKRPSTSYSESVYEGSLQPEPLQVKKDSSGDRTKVTTEVKDEWNHTLDGTANDELLAYINA